MAEIELPFTLYSGEELIGNAHIKYDGPAFDPKDFGMGYKALEAVLDNSRVEYDKLIEENIISGEYNTYLTNKRLLFYKPNWWECKDKGIFCRIPFESIVGIDYSLEYKSTKVYVKPLIGKIGEITVTFTFDQPDDYNELLKWVDTIKSGSMSCRANLLNASYFEPKVKKSFRDPILDFTKKATDLPCILRNGEKLLRENYCYYYGERETFATTGSGVGLIGKSGFAFGMNRSKSVQRTEEDGLLDSKPCVAYLTNQRIILYFHSENRFVQYPLDKLIGIDIQEGGWIHSRKLKFSIDDTSGLGNSFRLGYLYPVLADDWMQCIKLLMAKQSTNESTSDQKEPKVNIEPTVGGPLQVLKMRFARGEISKDEYLEMKELLEDS